MLTSHWTTLSLCETSEQEVPWSHPRSSNGATPTDIYTLLAPTSCSVGGTHFGTYAKFLTLLGIPFAVITDRDPTNSGARGLARARRLLNTIGPNETGQDLVSEPDVDEARLEVLAEANGIFLNHHTLELDLYRGGFAGPVLTTLSEAGFGQHRRNEIRDWMAEPETADLRRLLQLIALVGKGRFAQRLAPLLADRGPPEYIAKAITFVADRV